jgi:hypothetical protein
MERCLDIAPIEVRRIAQLICRSWASLVYFVNVEATVRGLDCALGRIEDVAVVVCARRGLDTARGEDEVLVDELLIPTSFMRVLKAGQGAFAEMEELRIPLFDKWIGNDLFLNPVELSNARIIDESTWTLLDLLPADSKRDLTGQIKVRLVILVQHRSRDVGNVSSGIALPCNVDLEVADPKGRLEVLEKSNKILRNLFFRAGSWGALRKSSADWLLHPAHGKYRTYIILKFTYQSMLVMLTQECSFRIGAEDPGYQTNRPFSSKKPSRDEHPGPPFSQMVISSTASPMVGWNIKKSSLDVSPD